jgi:metallo-beta-lactamase family protein
VYCLNELIGAGRIPSIPVYVDSPLAVNVTRAFREHPECYDAETAAIVSRDRDGDAFGFKRLTYVRESAESKKLNDMDGPLIVISASGMCENGRILHHLRHGIGDSRNTILFVSFQAPNTLGRKILDGMPYVRILGDEYRVSAEVRRIEAFSGHADRNDLLGWVKPRIKGLRQIFLVHGEIEPMKALAESLTDAGARSVEMPTRGEKKVLE